MIASLVALGASGASADARLRAPALDLPKASASVEAIGTFSWGAVRGAARYEFQLSDDPGFKSIVLGRGIGRGSQETLNTAATLTKTVPDGTYFWRVRAITKVGAVGRWTQARMLRKAWTTAPTLETAAELGVAWPSQPLLLRWSPVKYATKYLVTIASDPTLAQIVAATSGKPAEVPGVAFALQGTLPAGRYYWAVTPVDAGGLRGARSKVGTFTWTWPTATTTSIEDLNPAAQVFDPLLGWNLVTGAARYEVEVNPDDDFAAGSRVCCKDPVIGTSLSPVRILPNNDDIGGASGYHWRVRAFDVDGNPGQWNVGPTFEKAYDDVTPTVPGLHLRDYNQTLTPSSATVTPGPVIAWDPVPGAAQYHVQWTTYNGVNCNWSGASTPVKTSALAWTPLSPTHEAGVPGGVGITVSLGPNGTGARSGQPFSPEVVTAGVVPFVDGTTYCVRVRALSDDSFRENDNATSQVLSQWTQVGASQNQPAFTYQGPPSSATDPPVPPQLPAPTYLSPIGGTTTRTPLLRWQPVDGARRYFVFIARDSNFTNVIDAAFTAMPAYQPNWVLEDEATSYFWVVVPSATSFGSGIGDDDLTHYNPQHFNKLSVPPTPVSPVGGEDVTTQPTFRWGAAEGAQKYRLQVSADPQFGDLLDDVVTASTAYTSSTPYPVDTVLYWRVRAEQLEPLKGTVRVELRWSATSSFRRRLPVPALSGDIPLNGQLPPALTWTAVPGAISYDLHIDEADGDSNDFTVKSAAGTFTRFFGLGTFKFRVRANFATRAGAVASAYSAPRDFTRILSAPSGRRSRRTSTQLFFGWNPAAAAKTYRVEVSASESFSQVLESASTASTAWAPGLSSSDVLRGRKTLYWRVASIDDGGNTGAFATSKVLWGKPLTVRVRGTLRRNRIGLLRVSVRGSGRPLRNATVRGAGAGARTTIARTGRSGVATLRLRARRKGTVVVRVSSPGYRARALRVRVR